VSQITDDIISIAQSPQPTGPIQALQSLLDKVNSVSKEYSTVWISVSKKTKNSGNNCTEGAYPHYVSGLPAEAGGTFQVPRRHFHRKGRYSNDEICTRLGMARGVIKSLSPL